MHKTTKVSIEMVAVVLALVEITLALIGFAMMT